jgi:hypothetical protein
MTNFHKVGDVNRDIPFAKAPEVKKHCAQISDNNLDLEIYGFRKSLWRKVDK